MVEDVLQEARLNMGPNLSLKCVSFNMYKGENPKSVLVRLSYTIVRTLYNGMAVLHPLYCPDFAPFLFWKLKLALKGRRCGNINKNSLLLCAVQTVEGEDGRHIY